MLLLSAVNSVDVSALELGAGHIIMRLLCAMLVGIVIGTEREYTHRPAGMRTHILVALGACTVMITGQLIFAQYRPFGATSDPARLSAQVITGVGFLGAGTIIREGANVKGLTTAASLWAVACLGIAAGGGYYGVALVGMVFLFVTLTIFEFFQNKLVRPKAKIYKYIVETQDTNAALNSIHALADSYHCLLRDMQATNLADGTTIVFRVEISQKKKRPQKFFEALATAKGIQSAKLEEDMVEAK